MYNLTDKHTSALSELIELCYQGYAMYPEIERRVNTYIEAQKLPKYYKIYLYGFSTCTNMYCIQQYLVWGCWIDSEFFSDDPTRVDYYEKKYTIDEFLNLNKINNYWYRSDLTKPYYIK